MYLKIHEGKEGRVVAACDKELVGKVLEQNDHYIDLDMYRSFYVGESANADDVGRALENFDSANLVGKKAVDVAIHKNLAKDEDIMYINSTPYIQLYRI